MLSRALGVVAVVGAAYILRTVRTRHWVPESNFVQEVDLNSGDSFPDHLVNESESIFQRYILGKFRAKVGVPTVTQANLESVRRQIYAILREDRPDMRYADLEFHCTRITTMAFVPSKSDVEMSRMLIKDQSYWGTAKSWLWGTGPVQSRVVEMLRPCK